MARVGTQEIKIGKQETMIKEIYILWNNKDDRPAINREHFGQLCCYATLEQAQAYFSDFMFMDKKVKKEYEIIKLKVTK
jgi:hypothetical protein